MRFGPPVAESVFTEFVHRSPRAHDDRMGTGCVSKSFAQASARQLGVTFAGSLRLPLAATEATEPPCVTAGLRGY